VENGGVKVDCWMIKQLRVWLAVRSYHVFTTWMVTVCWQLNCRSQYITNT